MRESAIRSKILKFLNSLPNSDFVVSPPNSMTGDPDITGAWRPANFPFALYVGCEVKRPGQQPTKAQRYRLRKLKAAGAIVFVAHSVEEARFELQKSVYGPVEKSERRAANEGVGV